MAGGGARENLNDLPHLLAKLGRRETGGAAQFDHVEPGAIPSTSSAAARLVIPKAMPRFRRKKSGPDALLDVLPSLVGLMLLGVLFVPGFKRLLGTFFVVAICLIVVGAVGLIGWAIWRKRTNNWSHGVSPESDATHEGPAPRLPNRLAPSLGLAWTRELLSQLEWKRFEDVVAAYSRELGYEARTTRIGADGGVDVLLFQKGQAEPVMIIQCKAWDAYKIGVKPVRELFGVMAADKVANGGFFTTGEFTSEAEEWARGKNIDLVSGGEFLSRIGQLPAATQQSLLRVATEGDFTTPTCPSCGIKMVERVAGKGRSEGNRFWGCPNFPRGCKQTFKIS